MKTLVMTPDNINSKNKFRKPNILRKKPVSSKAKQKTVLSLESVDMGKVSTSQVECKSNFSSLKLSSASHSDDGTRTAHHYSDTKIADAKIDIKYDTSGIEEKNIKNDDSMQTLVNVDSFFNETTGENVMLYGIDYESEKQIEAIMVIDTPPVNVMSIEESPDLITNLVPLSTVTSQDRNLYEASVTKPIPNIYEFSTTVKKYKCDAPNCKKEFRSEQKMQKHKGIHNEDGTIKPARQVTMECPVKKIEPDGTELSCGRIFLVRELLVKHLNEEHTPDDASYRCEECDRRFFWASGLRAHARAHWRRAEAGAVYVCTWSGCGRVFRQPCRLREHARAHTGDRPYHCTYPNCGGSFRSASKLERHARRHTGERRHACGVCARAFLRRDHLRDHLARHHGGRDVRREHTCAHPGCEQSFNNMSTMYSHMKKVHKSKEFSASETATTETVVTTPQQEENNTLVVNLVPEGDYSVVSDRLMVETENVESSESKSEGGEREWRAARTHCTWPLERVPSPVPAPSPAADDQLHDQYTVYSEPVDQSENSENNIYTVRSDLFLHGNVMINDDSEQSSGAVEGTNDALDADLGMLDAHPGGDLMQEELMYTDVAADESSFRIFLLSGEELT